MGKYKTILGQYTVFTMLEYNVTVDLPVVIQTSPTHQCITIDFLHCGNYNCDNVLPFEFMNEPSRYTFYGHAACAIGKHSC